jgi:hypothetical protein
MRGAEEHAFGDLRRSRLAQSDEDRSMTIIAEGLNRYLIAFSACFHGPRLTSTV